MNAGDVRLHGHQLDSFFFSSSKSELALSCCEYGIGLYIVGTVYHLVIYM